MYSWTFTFPNYVTCNELVVSVFGGSLEEAIDHVKSLGVADEVDKKFLTYVEQFEEYEEDIPEEV